MPKLNGQHLGRNLQFRQLQASMALLEASKLFFFFRRRVRCGFVMETSRQGPKHLRCYHQHWPVFFRQENAI